MALLNLVISEECFRPAKTKDIYMEKRQSFLSTLYNYYKTSKPLLTEEKNTVISKCKLHAYNYNVEEPASGKYYSFFCIYKYYYITVG
jgi:hypothetical protein